MAKRRGAVLLEEEMADPRETVAADHGRGQPEPVAGGDRHREAADYAERADEMQSARNRIAMLVEVIGIELGEVREMLSVCGVRHDGLRDDTCWSRAGGARPSD